MLKQLYSNKNFKRIKDIKKNKLGFAVIIWVDLSNRMREHTLLNNLWAGFLTFDYLTCGLWASIYTCLEPHTG